MRITDILNGGMTIKDAWQLGLIVAVNKPNLGFNLFQPHASSCDTIVIKTPDGIKECNDFTFRITPKMKMGHGDEVVCSMGDSNSTGTVETNRYFPRDGDDNGGFDIASAALNFINNGLAKTTDGGYTKITGDVNMGEYSFNNSNKWVTYLQNYVYPDGHKSSYAKYFRMRERTLQRWKAFEKEFAKRYPGFRVEISCTTEGAHSSPEHPDGTAIDFVIVKNSSDQPVSTGYGQSISPQVCDLARKFFGYVFDEYRNGSTYKTGSHIHMAL